MSLFIINQGSDSLTVADRLFMMVGSPGYTMVVLIGCAEYIPTDYGYFATNPVAAPALKAVALFGAIWLWVLTFFFFLLAAYGTLASAPREMCFTLPWWAFIFPNVVSVIKTMTPRLCCC